MFFMYILYSEKFDRYYVGSTENVELRLHRHNNKMVTSTKRAVPWLIVYTEHFATRAEAVNRESQVKKMKSRKYIEALIANNKIF